MINRRLLLFYLVCLPYIVLAQGYFEYDDQSKAVYKAITSLQFSKAYEGIASLKFKSPDNLVVHHLENYLDFFYLYVNGDQKSFDRLKPRRARRIELVSAGDKESPYYLYVQAEIYLQWALIRLRFGEQLNGFMDINRANRLLEKNRRRFPDFIPNLKDLGILHAMVGTIPDNYQWGVKLLTSLNGTIRQGREELEKVVDYANKHEFLFREEARSMYAYLLMHLAKDEEAAWKVIRTSGLSPKTNPLHCFIMSNIAMRSGHNNEAIQILSNFRKDDKRLDFPYLDYMLGLAKLRRLDSDAAPFFQRFLGRNKTPYYVKEAYQKLAWQSLINGKSSKYTAYMKACLSNGEAIAGGDKNAYREAKSMHQPREVLVKARLLFDGAYFRRAHELMRTQNRAAFTEKRDQLEYTYRLGRILHGLERWQEAIQAYEETIQQGERESYFFACNAALQIGLIHELLGEKGQAQIYFKRCLSINPNEYKTGLHQQAKSGLARVKNSK
ncbi:MAG: tetratricopeptide repeat protein [Saprospiraceae bacterium]|nr:tetratricopeptide repeat protein [Saprospiraceae bacterium]